MPLFVVAVYVTAMRSEPFTVHTIFLSTQLGAALLVPVSATT